MSRRTPRIGMGTASLVVIFAVLSLTVFSLLTLMTARNDRALAQRTADSVQSYYAADTQAAHIRKAVEQAARAGALPSEIDGVALETAGGEVRYACPMGEGMALRVTLALSPDGATTVRAWQAAADEAWQADTTIQVWDGEGE